MLDDQHTGIGMLSRLLSINNNYLRFSVVLSSFCAGVGSVSSTWTRLSLKSREEGLEETSLSDTVNLCAVHILNPLFKMLHIYTQYICIVL